MVAVSVFVVVVVAGMGALLNANLLFQKSRDMRSILDNMNFIMEEMSRNIRTGYNYHCGDFSNITNPKSCSSGGNIFFEEVHASANPPVATDQWGYRFVSTDGGVTFNLNRSINGGGSWGQLNPDEVDLKAVSGFSVFGAESGGADAQQPFVVIKLVGTIKTKGVETPFSLQTTVSQRVLDL
jgi:hypothetical protein